MRQHTSGLVLWWWAGLQLQADYGTNHLEESLFQLSLFHLVRQIPHEKGIFFWCWFGICGGTLDRKKRNLIWDTQEELSLFTAYWRLPHPPRPRPPTTPPHPVHSTTHTPLPPPKRTRDFRDPRLCVWLEVFYVGKRVVIVSTLIYGWLNSAVIALFCPSLVAKWTKPYPWNDK